ncbi:MAG TPA: hypothetical protein VK582_18035 [Pyrinomonadaceae bacterium]|nr:hypothetical protein [Pyrinomonadaceae bacterium]
MINPDFDKLLSAVIPIAQAMLKDHGAFVPFGAFITREGEVQLAGGHGDPSHLETSEIMEMYLDAYREAAGDGSFTSTALCVDVRIQVPGRLEKTDAIQIMLEHSGGEALNAFMPYEKQAESDITYASLFATPADPRVFIKLAPDKEQ